MNLHEKTASAAKSSWHTSKSSVTAYGDVLLRYESTMNDREQVGGILWAYRKMRNGSIYDEEGVWLHARLLASNASQYLVAVVYTIALVAVYYWIFTSSDDEETQVPTVSPAPSINPVVAAADAIQPLLDSFLSVMRPLDDETVDLLWQRADVNGTAAITSDILESISNKTLQKSLSMLDSKTLATLVLWGREILSADSESRSRLLQESSGDDKDDYDIFSGWVVPEPWT